MKPVLYVVINKSLDMSAGKVAAQTAHAVAGVMSAGTYDNDWFSSPHRWVIVLEADDSMQLWHLHWYLNERNVHNHVVVDEGANEIRPMSFTALGVGVLDKDSQEARYLSGFRKFSHRDQLDRAFWRGVSSTGKGIKGNRTKDHHLQLEFPWY